MKVKRITPEMVVAAYEKTGMKAQQNGYYGYSTPKGDKIDCACGVAALYACTRPAELRSSGALEYAEGAYGVTYTRGFMDGFDDYERQGMDPLVDYLTGWSDGRAAWTAAHKEGLTV